MKVSIFVEGPYDKKFIEDLLKFLDPPGNKIKPIVIEGYTNLINFKTEIEKTNDLKGKNFIIFDADNNKNKKKTQIGKIEKELDCSIDYFFMPNDHDNGDLEDLLMKMINPKHQVIFDCFDSYQKCLTSSTRNYTLPNKKARIFAYCEAILDKKEDEMIDGKKRDYLDTRLWDLHAEFLNPLKIFLEKIIKFHKQ